MLWICIISNLAIFASGKFSIVSCLPFISIIVIAFFVILSLIVISSFIALSSFSETLAYSISSILKLVK